MIKLKGNLRREDNNNGNCEYILENFMGEFNLSKYLSNYLLNSARIKIFDNNSNVAIFDKRGLLYRDNTMGRYKWDLWIAEYCVDDILYGISTKYNNNISITFDDFGKAKEEDAEIIGGLAE